MVRYLITNQNGNERGSGLDRITYSTELYQFRDVVESWFWNEGILPVSGLSELHYEKTYDLFERENDQSTIWHECFYKKIRQDGSFNDIYTKFLTNVIKARFDEEIVYQKIPTFRVHLPGNVSVGEFHKDKHYRNQEWADKVQELNYFVPLTKAYGTNTIWAETEENLGDFQEISATYGECVEWSASKLTHGNKQNITRNTRVSFDFRVIPLSKYDSSWNSDSPTSHTKFVVGEYYKELQK